MLWLYSHVVYFIFKLKLGMYYDVITFTDVLKWGFLTWNPTTTEKHNLCNVLW